MKRTLTAIALLMAGIVCLSCAPFVSVCAFGATSVIAFSGLVAA